MVAILPAAHHSEEEVDLVGGWWWVGWPGRQARRARESVRDPNVAQSGRPQQVFPLMASRAAEVSDLGRGEELEAVGGGGGQADDTAGAQAGVAGGTLRRPEWPRSYNARVACATVRHFGWLRGLPQAGEWRGPGVLAVHEIDARLIQQQQMKHHIADLSRQGARGAHATSLIR